MKPAYNIMQEPLTVDPKREFRLIGHVTSIHIDVDITVIKILYTDHRVYDNNQTTYSVKFLMPRKIFVDKYLKADDLVICIGEFKSDDDDNIYLEGNYMITFRGMENIWKEPRPAYIDPSQIPEDSAF